MKAVLLSFMCAAGPWQQAPSVAPQWVGAARPKPNAELRRVVTVSPSATEILFALGVGDRVVAVSRFDDRPAQVKALPKVGGFTDPNVEAIVAARPDLVLAAANADNRPRLEALARLGVPVFAVPGNTLADAFAATRAVAKLFEPKVKARGDAVTADMRTKIELMRADEGAGPRVLVVFAKSPLIVAGPGSLADSALQLVGATNVAGQASRAYPTWGPEALVAARPDVIIDATGAHGATQPAPWAGLDVVPAVRAGRVVTLDLAVLLRPSPRFVDGLAALGAALARPTVSDGVRD